MVVKIGGKSKRIIVRSAVIAIMVNLSAASATKPSQVSQRLPQPLRQRLRVDEVVQRLVVGGEDVVAAAAPGEVPLIDERDSLADGDDGVEVVGVDHGGGVEFVGDFGDELVDEQRGFGIEAGVGLVEEEVLGITGQRTGDGGAFLHTTAQLRRIEFVYPFQIHAFQAEVGTVEFFALALFGEHVQREGDILLNGHGVEQRGTLEHHPHFLAEQQFVLFRQVVEFAAAVENFALLGRVQPHQALHQHRLARAGAPDDQVHLALLELRVNAEKHLLLAEILGNVSNCYHLDQLLMRLGLFF